MTNENTTENTTEETRPIYALAMLRRDFDALTAIVTDKDDYDVPKVVRGLAVSGRWHVARTIDAVATLENFGKRLAQVESDVGALIEGLKKAGALVEVKPSELPPASAPIVAVTATTDTPPPIVAPVAPENGKNSKKHKENRT